eukprot:TRINITY_DN64783_c1_g2_i1.p1 TRINITY_DN64783_c1_g2~~TRINITY_DN64783_c1_g2_i1.p1  ORF type:complete len:689 (+),score=2.70 TRINITY_DN64783_c1_g2_i1:63-2129(+)
MSTTENTVQSSWMMPQSFCTTEEELARTYPLMVYNSMTRTKNRFIPRDPNHVTWYQCGPTVYADSHLGHARTYVSLDVIRRITKDFLGYNVILCQNVTDVDDKIIIRSSERKIPFTELTAKYEAEFIEDMEALGVLQPDIVTRVSEYVPEVIIYIERLIEKRFAYPSNGSVYFNTVAFTAAGHTYGKLMPEQIGNSELLAEGEGSLAINDDKKDPSDFVLWKKTKDHKEDNIVEPSWPSPWGNGRPGWHIECSVMSNFALETLGGNKGLDIHCGGTDLKFPHHENEIAQSEGYTGSKQWVNYFLHTGHLNIKGLKMAKSLKNFITIREALEVNTPRQIRFCFLLHKYNAPMDYGDGSLTQAVSIDRIFNEYFLNIKALLRRYSNAKGVSGGKQHKGNNETILYEMLETTKMNVRNALLDDFDTPRAITYLLELMKECNRYVDGDILNEYNLSTVLINSVAIYITKILDIFGLVQNTQGSNIGFGSWGGSILYKNGQLNNNMDENNNSKEQILSPLLDVLTGFRETVRVAAISKDENTSKTILNAADALRDDILPELGIRMEDKGSGKDVVTVWKLEDKEILLKEKAQREEIKAQKAAIKAEALRKQKEKEEKAKINPNDMFRGMTDLYSQFDEKGIPTHDIKNEPLSKGALKKLQKEYNKQLELYEKAMGIVKTKDINVKVENMKIEG